MKTSPNDVSNKDILKEFREVSKKMDTRVEVFESSNKEILHELRRFSKSVDERFEEVLETTNTFATDTEARFIALEREQARMRSNMVTKDYLDDKMADLHSDMARYTRREIEKALN